MTVELGTAVLALAIWIGLILGRGGFWLGREHESRNQPAPVGNSNGEDWPSVVAIVPARNEADMLPRSLASLSAQDYRGAFAIIVVDDESDDGTADVARWCAAESRRALYVLNGEPLPKGWNGKVWAQQQGIAYADSLPAPPHFLLLTDADIAYAPESLTRLVTRARAGTLVMTSRLRDGVKPAFSEGSKAAPAMRT